VPIRATSQLTKRARPVPLPGTVQPPRAKPPTPVKLQLNAAPEAKEHSAIVIRTPITYQPYHLIVGSGEFAVQ